VQRCLQETFEGDVIRATVNVNHIEQQQQTLVTDTRVDSETTTTTSVTNVDSTELKSSVTTLADDSVTAPPELPTFAYKKLPPKHSPAMDLNHVQRAKWERKKARNAIKGRARLEIRQYLGPHIRSVSTGGTRERE
jgi:hypothetical protein